MLPSLIKTFMVNFISTEMVILLSLIGKKTPNLLQSIIQHSTSSNKKITPPLPVTLLSSQQIQEAREHPNTIIIQALRTIAIIQDAANNVATKLNELTRQREIIEHALNLSLQTNNQEMPNTPPNNSSPNSKNLQQQLVNLNQKS